MNNKNNYLRKPLILTSLPLGVMSFLIPIYSKKLNMNAVEITGLFSVISLILIIMRPILGKFVDKFGRKPILICSCIFFAISYAIFSVSNTVTLLYIARIFQGIATASMTISTYTIISDITKEENLSKAFGKINSYKSIGCLYGCIIAFLISSFMRFTQGWKVLFIIFSIACIYAVIEVIKGVAESKKSVIDKNDKDSKNISKDTKKLLVIIFITYLSSSMLGSIIIIYMQDKFTNDIFLLAYAFLPVLLAESLFSKKIGAYSDNYGKKYSMILGIIICGVVAIVTPSVSSLILLSILWIISTLSGVLYSLSEKNIYTSMNNKSSMGSMYSIYSIVCDFGLMIGPIIGGLLYDNVSSKAPFYLNGILMFISAILILILIKEKIQKN
ncbi:Metal-tetracycline/H(+) antiporter [uncultured Clostridium sp.]|nr:Metal-tetracycline/H(+) antiporter [uncultured Clostridium sp.]SCI81950.1 Metal-tetracycline/H(+) antiporter [uncultured Clostridium sp.]